MLGASRSIQVYSNQNMLDFESYLSPFSWRYASEEMRSIWSEAHKRRLWRRLWYTLAEVQAEFGVFGEEQVEELKKHVEDVDVQRSLEIEAEIHHDLMAELKAYAEQCPNAGGVLHLGATAMDIEDNADALRIRQAYDLLLGKLCRLLLELAERIERWADVPVLAFTHLQPAEPTTLGYRLAQYAQDLLTDWRAITYARDEIRGKGFKGAVGTSASFADLLGVERLAEFEARLSARLGLEFYPVSGQT
jgi:adenylosuccinate lyase